MKRLSIAMVFACALILNSCGEKKQVDTTNCKDHERNCPVSENCPEHPECEAHESCPKGEDCQKHPSCVAYEKSEG